jgi:predicted acetyltransferase
LPEFRGRGFAPRVLAFAEEQERLAGKTFSLLYSDIDPAYYERLGYRRCAAFQGWTNPMQFQSKPACTLTPFHAADELATLSTFYDRTHAHYALSIARASDYWRYLVTHSSQDEFYFVQGGVQQIGYVRLGIKPTAIVIRDLSLLEDTEEAKRGLYCAVIGFAKMRGAERVGGWMPADAVCRELFQVANRVQELTMVKPLVDRIKIDDRHCTAAEHFHEIDHV